MVNGNQTLYAQWTPLSFNVNYLSNGGMVTSQIATYVVGSPPLTLPNPTNSGFSFDGWFSAVTGGTFVGMGGALFTPASATTLYAQWSQIALNVVSFSANGGTGAVSPLSGGSTGPVVLPSGTGMTESAHNFSGWNSLSNGLGIAYAVGAPFTIGTSQTLFAQWAPDVYVVSFSSEGGNVGSGSVSYTYGTSALTMPVATMTDSTFDGWYTSVNGGTRIGLAGSTYTPTGTITLYAQWTRSIPCTLTFMANGGSGSIGSITVPQGTSVNIPGQKGLLRPGYVVSRWNTNANGRGVSYSIGQSKVITRSQDLYAQWSGHAPAFLLGAVGNFSRGSATLTGALKRHVNAMAIIIKTRKYFTVTLYGYTTPMGMQSLDAAVSRARARSVANYLIRRLAVLKFRGVNIRFSGQGAIAGGTSPIYSRVEVFVQ